MSLRNAAAGATVVAFAVLLGGCATMNAPVPVTGSSGDVAELAGRWEGTYESTAAQRSGTIEFRLEEGQDTAFGSVVMMPGSDPIQEYDPISGPGPQWLDINFVRCDKGVVTGTLGPYLDLGSGQTLHTIFQGFLEGNRIEGTYTTRVQGTGDELTGRWRAKRKSDSAVR